MFRACILAIIVGVPAFAGATENPDPTPAEFMPVARASSGVFDALKPLLNAREQAKDGDFENSFQNYGMVLLHDPNNIEALFGLGEASLELGKAEIAVKAYSKLSKHELRAPQKTEQFIGHVLANVMSGDLEDPEARLKLALKIAPDDYRLWNALGQHYDKRKDWTQSWEAYQRAAKAGFSRAGLHNNLGMSFLAQGKYQGAVSQFKYAAMLNPDDLQIENNYRFALLISGDYHTALKGVSDDQAGDLLSDAGYIAMQRKEFLLARTLLEKAVEVSPRFNIRAARNLELLQARQN